MSQKIKRSEQNVKLFKLVMNNAKDLDLKKRTDLLKFLGMVKLFIDALDLDIEIQYKEDDRILILGRTSFNEPQILVIKGDEFFKTDLGFEKDPEFNREHIYVLGRSIRELIRRA